MPDRETVVKAVETCFDDWIDRHRDLNSVELDRVRQYKSDALALLREQEAVAPVCTEYDRSIVLFSCRDCKTQLLYGQRYCNMCGRKVKWDD